jgi:hypothetical protein
MPPAPHDRQDLIPSYFSPAVACRLLHCSSELLVDAISKGVISLEPCAVLRTKISRGAVEKLLGRALTLEDVAAAWNAGEPRRRANARYYANKKRGVVLRPAMLELMPVKGTA